jgi:UDP-glucose 4-epimerase
MKVLVTGAAGYIGSHTVIHLLENGHEVVGIDNFSNARPEIPQRITAITGKPFTCFNADVRNTDAIEQFIHSEGPFDGVIHFAAYKAVGESVEKPLAYYDNNLNALLSILSLLKKCGIPAFVFSSSCTVYGTPTKLPVDESCPWGIAESPYGYTKQIGEKIIQDFNRSNPEIKTLSLRYFNPIGAHPTGEIGELPGGIPNNLLPYITQTLMKIRPSLRIWGNDYPTPDGTCIRDYIHVSDLAAAHLSALMALHTSAQNIPSALNIGTGQGSSVLEVVHAFEKATGLKVPYTIEPRRPGDISVIYANPTLAEKTLQWKSKYSLEDALKHAWSWEQRIPEEWKKMPYAN